MLMNVGDIKGIRKKLGLSQQEFANKLKVGLMTVSRWERGISKPSNLALEKLNKFIKKQGQNESAR